jgi:apolipoprotein N-acyltransferase
LALWIVTLLGVAGLSCLIETRQRVWQTLLIGLAFGLGLAGSTLNWMAAIFVEAMVAITVAVALFYVAVALAIRYAKRVAAWPFLAAGIWAAQEALISRQPFDGFGWVRLGYAMLESPLAFGYPLIGVAGVSFLAALLAQCAAWVVSRPKSWPAALATALLALAVCLPGALVQAGASSGRVSVGWVQGGAPGGGVYGLGEARTITKNEVAGTLELAQQIAAGALPAADFVVWPENGTDLDPFADGQTRQLVEQAVAAIRVPLLVGIISNGPGPNERQTVSQWWDASGPGARYAKRGIVPFGEWVPYRDILEPLIPKLSYVGAQSVPGTEPGVMPVELAAGDIRIGILLCYDVTFDEYVYDLVRGDADIIVVQSSNAMYQGTGQISQQFAMTRVRAAELRREALVVTTSGISGLIASDGSVVWSSGNGQLFGVDELDLRTGRTPVTYLQPWLELAIAFATVIGLCCAFALGRSRRSGTMDDAAGVGGKQDGSGPCASGDSDVQRS